MRTMIGLLIALAPAAASAAVINPSFETPSAQAAPGYVYNPAGAGWTFTSYAGIAYASPFNQFASTTAEGAQVAFLQSFTDGQQQLQQGSISQTLTALTAGGTYQVTFNLALRSAAMGAYSADPITVTADGLSLGTFTPTSTTFAQFTASNFVAGPTGNVVLSFLSGASSFEVDTLIDLVQVAALRSEVSDVPEPASMALLSMGVVGMMMRRKRA